MCLVLLAVDVVARFPLLLLANRDEFHARASADAHAWAEDARVAGGRDLVAGGTWLAARSDGRFAAITNVRSGVPATAPKSRGALVRDFVLGADSPAECLHRVRAEIDEYGPFNLIVGAGRDLRLLSSTGGEPIAFGRGVHVISNGAPDVHWPKTERLQRRFQDWLHDDARNLDVAFDLLRDAFQPADADLPETGVGLELERTLAPIFISAGHYGTRAGSLLAHADDGSVLLRERRFDTHGRLVADESWRAARGATFARAAS